MMAKKRLAPGEEWDCPRNIYTDYETLLEDARDTYQGYPGAEAMLMDDTERRRTGIVVFVMELAEDLEYSWQFWISFDDFKRSPLFEWGMSATGRNEVMQRYVQHAARLPPPEYRDIWDHLRDDDPVV